MYSKKFFLYIGAKHRQWYGWRWRRNSVDLNEKWNEETRLARNEAEREEEDKSIQLIQKIHRSIFPTKKADKVSKW